MKIKFKILAILFLFGCFSTLLFAENELKNILDSMCDKYHCGYLKRTKLYYYYPKGDCYTIPKNVERDIKVGMTKDEVFNLIGEARSKLTIKDYEVYYYSTQVAKFNEVIVNVECYRKRLKEMGLKEIPYYTYVAFFFKRGKLLDWGVPACGECEEIKETINLDDFL